MIDEIQNDETIKMTNSNSYKQFIKSKIRMRALKYLKSFQQTHSKVKEIVYEKLEVQPYLTSPLFSNDEVNLLHRLRSRMTECKANFKQKYVHNLKLWASLRQPPWSFRSKEKKEEDFWIEVKAFKK